MDCWVKFGNIYISLLVIGELFVDMCFQFFGDVVFVVFFDCFGQECQNQKGFGFGFWNVLGV